MSRPLGWIGWLTAFAVLLLPGVPGYAQRSAPESSAEDAEEARDRRNMERFLELLEKSPRKGTALDRVYGYHVERGTLDDLVKGLEDRVAKSPGDGTGWMLLGLFESQRGRDAAAVTAFRRAEETRPADPLPAYYQGQALVLVGQPEEAAAALERALERKPKRNELLEIFQALGRVYQRTQKTEQALAVWSRLEALFPNDPRVREQIAAALAEEGQPAQALPRYEALARSVKDPFRQAQLAMTAADLKVRLGRTDQALGDFESLLGRLRPDSWLYREVRRKIDEVFLRNDDQAGLTDYYEAWSRKNPDDVEALVRLGRSLAAQGRLSEARAWYEKAIKLAPTRRDLRLALIGQLVQDQKFADAAAQYEAMDRAEPNNPDTLRDWGGLLLRDTARPEAARRAAAAAVWRRLLEARPNDPVTAAGVADLFRQAGMTDEALGMYRKAAELAPGDPQYREYLGEYLHVLKRSDEALATWSEMAAGPNRTPKNLVRLAEVLAGFGYLKQAIPALEEAVRAEADDFTLRLKLADLLHRAERYGEARAQLDAAERLAEKDEERAAALEAQVKNDAAAGTLADRIAALRRELEGPGTDAKAKAVHWARLARYLEADGKLPEAEAAVARAVEADPRSVPAWTLAARIRESAGQLGDAAAAFRRLAEVDRRNRTEYLTGVAKIEARLGRADEALKAGRDLIAAAPGNPESYEFFAGLCNQLGRHDEGLDALRRAVRINPNETGTVLTLAETLAGLYRTDEAVEMYWRAYEKAADLDEKVGVVSRLTDLYVQRNQFDRLLARLEHAQGDSPSQQQVRELAICTAQAYASSGDLGSARAELESLLAANARDTQLLQQLSKLAEDEGDLESAAKYQKQLQEIAPSDERALRLAQLYLRYGDLGEAEALWSKLATGPHETHRVFQALDGLLGNNQPRAVLEVTEALVRKDPGDWEALYRQGVALAQLGESDEALRRFRALLELRVEDDERSALARARRRDPKLQATGARPSRLAQVQRSPTDERLAAVLQVRLATGLEVRNIPSASRSAPAAWAPADFGQARMAALGWMLGLSQKQGADALAKTVDTLRPAAGRPSSRDVRALWDWYYACALRNEYRPTYEAARDLSRASPGDPAALWAYLNSLATRQVAAGPRYYAAPGTDAKDGTPPLEPDEIAYMLSCARALRQRRPDLVQPRIVNNVSAELKRARRAEDADRFYAETFAAAESLSGIAAAFTLAGERGDADGLIRLFDRWERLQGRSTPTTATGMVIGGSYFMGTSYAMGMAMGVMGQAKNHADITRLLDHYLAAARRRLEAHPARSGRSPAFGNAYPQGYTPRYAVWVGGSQRSVQVGFPLPNEYYDQGAISLLRNAYEVYKRDDLLSDLTAHFRKQADEAKTPADAVYPRLALSYLNWWEDDKDAAIAEFTRVAEASRTESDLRLTLAELLDQHGELAEALGVVDAVKPLDHTTTQRREEQALRLAVLTGNLERARQAAERLFGLRLDTETQVRLAGQMHQLGMHDLAESVLARARRRAGGKASALVGLMLQYQRQDRTDAAVQVALQILRSTTAFHVRNPNVYYADDPDAARAAAIQVLARSGRIKAMIERAEEQVRRTPGAIQLHQALSDYYRADNQRDKARAELERIVELRPDDAALRYQVATQLRSEGRTADALVHLRAAIKKDPMLLGRNYYNVENTFRAARKMDELVQLVESIDLRSLGQPHYATNLIQRMAMDPSMQDKVMPLFRKAWEAFPDQRIQLFTYIRQDVFWQSPETYEYARQAFVGEGAGLAPRLQWYALEGVRQIDGQGRATGTFTQFLDLAASLGKLDSLGDEVAAALEKAPGWTAGKAMLAMIRCRMGRFDDADRLIRDVLQRARDETVPMQALWVIGSDLENYGPTLDLATTVYETSVSQGGDDPYSSLNFDGSPVRRLVAIYERTGRKDDVRKAILEFARPKDFTAGYPDEYIEQMRLQGLTTAARQLVRLGYTVDAIPLLTESMALGDRLDPSGPNYIGDLESISKQARDGLDRAVQGLNDSQLAETVQRLIEAGSDPEGKTGPSRARDQAVDLVVLVHPRALSKATVKSLFAEAVEASARVPGRLGPIAESLARLRAERADDFSVRIASALVALASGDRDKSRAALDDLKALVDEKPLEALPPGGRANARQRAEASRQVPLWVVARSCAANPWSKEFAGALSARAFEAAGRESDNQWILAMLREQGQWALDRGDAAGADASWGRMLELLLARDAARPRPSQSTPAPASNAPPATPAPPPPAPPARGAVRTSRAAVRGVSAAPAPKDSPARKASPASRGPRNNVPILTIERFEQVMELAKLAAEHGRIALSLRAAREALAGGPPVPVPTRQGTQRSVIIRSRSGDSEPADTITPRVIAQLVAIEAEWRRKPTPPGQVYATLRDLAMPAGRPDEVFLYAQPLNAATVRRPRSLAGMLTDWAVREGQLDDLRARVEARRARPMASLPAAVLSARLELAGGDPRRAVDALKSVAEQLRKNTLRSAAELGCHAGLPALAKAETAPAAIALLDLCIKPLSAGTQPEPSASLLLLMTRRQLELGDREGGRKRLDEYLEDNERSGARYSGDSVIYIRKRGLQHAAAELARLGLWRDTLEILGRFVDSPAYSRGDPPLGNELALLTRQLAAQPPRPRYETLRAWTLPAENRRMVRLLAATGGTDRPPALFSPPAQGQSSSPVDEVVSTATALVAAAREAGTLDALADETRRAAEERVENAETLLVLVDLARGKAVAVKPRLQARIDALLKAAAARPDSDPLLAARTAVGLAAPFPWDDYLVARAALADDDRETVELGLRLAGALLEMARKSNRLLIPRLARDIAEGTIKLRGEPGLAARSDGGLALWHPAVVRAGYLLRESSQTPWWAAHQGTLAHLSGAGQDFLLFDYPLAGSYKVSIEAYFGDFAEAGVTHDGLVLEPFSRTGVAQVTRLGGGDQLNIPWNLTRRNDFNQLTIEATPGKVRYLANGHLFHEEDDPSPTSPWLGLATARERRSAWRNLSIEGKATIPREVRLVQGDRLEGWAASFYNESLAPRKATNDRGGNGSRVVGPSVGGGVVEPDRPDEFDWAAHDGELQGRRLLSPSPQPVSSFTSDSLDASAAVQSRLYYVRPLRDGETLTYEFFYEPDQVMVHPALDRLALLVEPDGVRLHWMTSPYGDPSGLNADNVADDPSGLLGTEKPPLKAGEWNTAELSLEGGTATLTLNGSPIYRRALEPANSRQFGFYHDKDRTSVRVRNVVLRGGWPESIPNALRADLASTSADQTPTAGERSALHALIGEPLLGRDAGEVLRRAAQLEPGPRYAYLAAWVLPDDDHPVFRLQGVFTPANPVVEADAGAARGPARQGAARVFNGGAIRAPAVELVEAARLTGKLDELAARIERAEARDDISRRGKLALAGLIAMARNDDDGAGASLESLKPLLQATSLDATDWARWPELAVSAAAIRRPALRARALDLLETLAAQAQKVSAGRTWENQVKNVRARGRLLEVLGSDADPFGNDPGLAHWSSVVQTRAETRGGGAPAPAWVYRDGALTHHPGHALDMLYLDVPLRGDFELECELTGFGWRELRISYGGMMAGPKHDLKHVARAHYGRNLPEVAINPPLEKIGDWYGYRLVVKGGTMTSFVGGRRVFQTPLPAECDPWLALYCEGQLTGGIRNLRIKGKPTIPTRLNISALPDLTGWRPDEYGDSVTGNDPDWTRRGDEIVGRCRDSARNDDAAFASPALTLTPRSTLVQRGSTRGSKRESVLRYHRPFLEDGTISYEFYYEPGRTLVHPAIDRLALVLDPEGISRHWLTDAQYERTGLAPENAALEPERRRGPARLPLRPDSWNRAVVSLAGDQLSFHLNGELVYQRTLEPTNQRTFGLFHFADETEVRVRNVTYEGKWRDKLPERLLPQDPPAAEARPSR